MSEWNVIAILNLHDAPMSQSSFSSIKHMVWEEISFEECYCCYMGVFVLCLFLMVL